MPYLRSLQKFHAMKSIFDLETISQVVSKVSLVATMSGDTFGVTWSDLILQ
jgi:hypothetical protein